MSEPILGIHPWRFTKNDLQFLYSSTLSLGDNPKLKGHPDRDEINRHEAYEVVDFINFYINKHCRKGLLSISLDYIETGRKIETMLRNGLPSHLRSREHIEDWILTNWERGTTAKGLINQI